MRRRGATRDGGNKCRCAARSPHRVPHGHKCRRHHQGRTRHLRALNATRYLLSAGFKHVTKALKRSLSRAEPKVRIQFPPAKSQTNSSRKARVLGGRCRDALVRRHSCIAVGHTSLHLGRTAKSIHHAAELDEQTVACRLDKPAVVRGDRRIEQLRPDRLQCRESAALVRPDQS